METAATLFKTSREGADATNPLSRKSEKVAHRLLSEQFSFLF